MWGPHCGPFAITPKIIVRAELGNFSWHRASARCPTAVFGTKTPPGRAVPRKILKLAADPTKSNAPVRARPFRLQNLILRLRVSLASWWDDPSHIEPGPRPSRPLPAWHLR